MIVYRVSRVGMGIGDPPVTPGEVVGFLFSHECGYRWAARWAIGTRTDLTRGCWLRAVNPPCEMGDLHPLALQVGGRAFLRRPGSGLLLPLSLYTNRRR